MDHREIKERIKKRKEARYLEHIDYLYTLERKNPKAIRNLIEYWRERVKALKIKEVVYLVLILLASCDDEPFEYCECYQTQFLKSASSGQNVIRVIETMEVTCRDEVEPYKHLDGYWYKVECK